MNVLIVEDDPVTRRLFSQILGDRGHQVEVCNDAETAWALCQGQFFPFIVLDWLLPGMDGLELCRRIRTLPDGANSTILVATVREGREYLQAVLDAGADDYLRKPVSLGLLKIRLAVAEQQVLHRLERKRAEEQLERSHEDLLAMFDQLRPGTALTDSDGHLTFLNRAARELFFGSEKADFSGQHWRDLFPFSAQDSQALEKLALSEPQSRQRLQAQVAAADGRQYWVDVEVQDDPRDQRRKIFLFYDMSEVYDLRRQLEDKAQFHDLVGRSKPMLQVYEQIREVAKVDSTLLIEGDTGTGKELVARAVHESSHRRGKPFIAVNCAGLNESLIGSQLFGHKRGAFTGAVEDHKGFLETANGGTILLDEIGDIPMTIQASLLRVLQEREITRLGESKPRKIDVRVLAATHRDLGTEVAAGRFRQDLLYRIRVARVQLPSLAQRRGDIPLLVRAFLRKVRATTGKNVRDVNPAAMSRLVGYGWPGNVRELENAVEFAVVRATQAVIGPDDLPPETLAAVSAGAFVADGNSLPLDDKDLVLQALATAKGNRTAAARLMGISRATFYRRMSSLGIDKE
jgi:PAS domain S-box-containing protein